MDESLWSSLKENVRAALFPEKLPPLQLTSRPVKVRDIWGEYNYKKESAGVSVVVHVAMVAGLIALSIVGAKAIKQEKPPETVTLIAPDLTPQLPMTKKNEQTSGGGGGGGDRDKLQAPKGKLPKTGDGADHASCHRDSQRPPQASGRADGRGAAADQAGFEHA